MPFATSAPNGGSWMRIPRPAWAAGAVLVLGAGFVYATAYDATSASAFPATPRSTVINYLRSITGTSIVSGQHNKEPANQPGQYTQQVHDVTGQWPGLWGGDMMFRSA